MSSTLQLDPSTSSPGEAITCAVIANDDQGVVIGSGAVVQIENMLPTITASISANGSTEGPRWWGPGYPGAAGNPNLSEDIFGIKFDYEATTYTFVTDRAPVYGDIYVKKRSNDTAWNDGLGSEPTLGGSASYYASNWVPRPDTISGTSTGVTAVPSPAAAFAGIFLIGGGILRRRR